MLLCLLHVAGSKLPHVLLFSSLYFWCIVLVISSFILVVKLVSCVSLTSSLVLWYLLLLVQLISWYLCFVDFIFGIFMSSYNCQASKLVFRVSSFSMFYNLQVSSFQELLHRNRFVSVSLCFQKLIYHG